MVILAQENVGIRDNKILDQWNIPVGEWVDQAVDWIDQNLGWLLDAIKWPFDQLLNLFVERFLVDWVGWIWAVLALFIIGSLVRNVKVGAQAAIALAGSGLLGTAYWEETIRTIGMVLVAVLLCAVIGVPIGVLCGRFDGVWKVVRPTLDAMQVVHAFVYMLPIIFFFSIGPVPATMVTMIFALPPLIRLTNLGIRQVPGDVVEASRAYGAPELRVLFDVQLPLARPAIMTGLNQTLLLAISMIGIAAIMGARGLGGLVFRAVQNLDTGLAASAGLALFLVAVILDRISQPEDGDGGNLTTRIRQAWAHRQDVTPLLSRTDPSEPEGSKAPGFVPAAPEEAQGIYIAAAGAALGIVSVFLTWGKDSGLLSAYSRRSDESELVGQSFNGLDATGGSFYGIFVLIGALFILAAGATTLFYPGRGPRFLSADTAMKAAGAMLFAALGYLIIDPSDLVEAYSDGVGVYVAVLAGMAAFVGCYLWVQTAPYAAVTPLKPAIGYGRLFGGAIALLLVGIAMVSGWTFDKREDVVITPQIQAEIDALIDEARADPSTASVNATKISALQASARRDLLVIDGLSSKGAGLGVPSLLVALLAIAALAPAAGLLGFDEHLQWRWSAISSALAMGLVAISMGWIASLVRATDPSIVSGIGAFMVFLGGYFILSANRGVLNNFARKKLYQDDFDLPSVGSVSRDSTPTEAGITELVGVLKANPTS